MNEPTEPTMKDAILKTIQSSRVKMRPKWKFVLETALLVIGLILLTLTVLFISSFIVFALRQTGVWFTPRFGSQGYGILFSSLPWILIAVAIAFIIIIQILIEKYSFSYGRPFIYSALGVILLVIIGGVAMGYTSLHQNLFEQVENGHLALGRPLYEYFGQSPNNITVGTIIAITDNGCKLQDNRGQIFSVILTPQTKLPSNYKLKVKDTIVILGERQKKTIQAIAIKKPNNLPPSKQHHFEEQEESTSKLPIG